MIFVRPARNRWAEGVSRTPEIVGDRVPKTCPALKKRDQVGRIHHSPSRIREDEDEDEARFRCRPGDHGPTEIQVLQ